MKIFKLEDFKINHKDCFIQYGEHQEEVKIHRHHSFIEIVYVLEGSAKHVIKDEVFSIHKGDLFVVTEEQSHGYIDVEDLKIVNIMITPKVLKYVEEDIKDVEGYQTLFYSKTKEYNNKLHIKEGREELNRILDQLITIYDSNQAGAQSLFTAYLMIFLVLISRYVERVESKEYYCAKVVEYIEEHYNEKITVEECSKRSPWSSRQLARNFKEYKDCSLMEYVTKVRLTKAMGYLKDEDKIIDIAYKVGFNDSNYFSKRCKDVYGKTPMEIRKDFRNDSNRRNKEI